MPPLKPLPALVIAILLAGSAPLAAADQARALFQQQRWAEAAVAAREELKQEKPGSRRERSARVLLCQARAHLAEDLPGPEPLPVGPNVSRPEKIGGDPPPFPKGDRGMAILNALIDQEGCVRHVELAQGDHDFGESAAQAVRTWVFSPARQNGEPVPVHYTVTISSRQGRGAPR